MRWISVGMAVGLAFGIHACNWPGRAVLLDAPTAIAPVSGSVLSTQYPIFRWRTDNPAIDSVQIEICETVHCDSTPIAVFEAAAGDENVVWTQGLRRGTYFWRIRGMHGRTLGSVVSPTALFVIQTRLENQSSAVPARVMGQIVDVDRDGRADVVARGTGRVYVSRLNGAARELPRQILPPSEWDPSAEFGSAVASPGDLDGDGSGDLLVGAPGARAVSIHLGLRGNTLIVGNEVQRITAPPEFASTRFGAALSSGGDINGDGIPDMVIGAPAVGGSTDRGAALVYSTTGTPLAPVRLASVSAPDAGDGFGALVRSAGDFNGDGVGDLAVSAPSYVRNGVAVGRVYVYLGARQPEPALLAEPNVILESDSAQALGFGSAISTAGDIDRDGFDDIAVGEEHFDQSLGRVLVFRGSAIYSRTSTRQVASIAWRLSAPREGSGGCAGHNLAMR